MLMNGHLQPSFTNLADFLSPLLNGQHCPSGPHGLLCSIPRRLIRKMLMDSQAPFLPDPGKRILLLRLSPNIFPPTRRQDQDGGRVQSRLVAWFLAYDIEHLDAIQDEAKVKLHLF